MQNLFCLKFFNRNLLNQFYEKKTCYQSVYQLDGTSSNDECVFYQHTLESVKINFLVLPNLTNFKVCQIKYLEECLKADNCLHFNIDDRLLDCVINLVKIGNIIKNIKGFNYFLKIKFFYKFIERIHDVLIVPTSFSFEIDALALTNKPKSSFKMMVCKSLGLMLKNLFIGPLLGQIRVDFAQPFSLKVTICK